MKQGTMNILFFVLKTKLLKNGEAPILMRVTINGQYEEARIQRSVPLKYWNATKGCSNGKNRASIELNNFIAELNTKALETYKRLILEQAFITPKLILQCVFGKNEDLRTVLRTMKEEIAAMEKVVNIDYAPVTINLLSPQHPVTVFVIGAGGTGSQVVTNLARMDMALRSLGHAGLHVTVFDPDTVTEANIGRQLFSESEIGLNKAVALVSRINRFFGYGWEAEPCRYCRRKGENLSDARTANIILTCTDNKASRLEVWRILKGQRNPGYTAEGTPLYWMDFGNAATTGQVLIGTVKENIPQPVSDSFISVPKMNVITEEVDYSKIRDKDSGPSCSLAEALERQDLFINSILAQTGCEILWKMFREGRTLHRGAYLNLETLKVNPIPV